MTEDPVTIEPTRDGAGGGAPDRALASTTACRSSSTAGCVGVVTRLDVLDALTHEPTRRADAAAGARPGRPRGPRAQLRDARAGGRPGGRCARSSRPTATATAPCRGRARRAGGRRARGSPSRPRARRRRCARPGSTGPLLVMGALSARRARRRAARAGADVVAWREAFAAASPRIRAPPAHGVHVKLDTGMGRLGTRDPEEARARRRGRRRGPAPAARRRDDPLRHRRRRSRVRARAARALPARGRSALRARPRRPARPRGELRGRARRSPRRGSTSSAAASPSTGWTRSTATPPTTASSPRSSCAPTSPRSSAIAPGESAGYGRRFVAARADLDRDRADRLRATACAAR